MSFDFLAQVKTTDDVLTLQKELEALTKYLFSTKKDTFETALQEEVRAWVADVVRAQGGTTAATRKKFLDELNAQLKKLPAVQLTLAFQPTQKNIDVIHNWLHSQLQQPHVLHLVYDPSVVGGAVISYQGRYHDASLKKVIEETHATV